MEALITRIRAIEGHVARELSMSIDAEIQQAQQRVAGASGSGMETAFRELGALLEKRRDGRQHVREAAFAQTEKDKEFAPRVYLRLLSREIEEA
jgi:ABC-type polar amino acid transport system ATPase subunit